MTDRFGGLNVSAPLPGGCRCPGTPHAEGDAVFLLPRLSFAGGVAAEAVVQRYIAQSDADGMQGPLVEAYLRHQAVGWNLVDADGAPVPFSVDLLLSDYLAARAVGEVADDLYSGDLLAPLLAAASKSSPGGPTAPSTSARTPSGSTRRKP